MEEFTMLYLRVICTFLCTMRVLNTSWNIIIECLYSFFEQLGLESYEIL